MSLLRLLTAGSSLVGLKKPTVRYRMSDPRSLPKFGSAEKLRVRPQATTQAETKQTQSQRLSTLPEKVEVKKEKEESPAVSQPKAVAAVRGPEKKPAEAKAAKAPAAISQPARAAVETVASRSKNFLSKATGAFAGIKLLWQRKPGRAGQGMTGAVRQGELSLDNIKVLRNDLSDADADVAVVAARSRPAKVEAVESVPAEPEEEATESSLNRIAGGFLGLMKLNT